MTDTTRHQMDPLYAGFSCARCGATLAEIVSGKRLDCVPVPPPPNPVAEALARKIKAGGV